MYNFQWRAARSWPLHAAVAALLWPDPTAVAQTPDKSAYHLFNPTPRELMREMSTDRPDTTESPFTVDAGHFQIEMSLVDFAYDRHNEEGQTTRTVSVAPMLLKAGLLNSVDLQIGIDPYTRERSTDRASSATQTIEGFGDTIIRLKLNLWGNDIVASPGDTVFAFMPFIKLPTASDDLGNDHVEGGVIFPLAVQLPDEWGLGLMAELDFIRDSEDDDYVVDFVHTITLGRDIFQVHESHVGAYVEYAGFADLNGDQDYRGYFDAGLTYGLTEDIQFDAGIRVGLTEAADDFGVFTGMSWRF